MNIDRRPHGFRKIAKALAATALCLSAVALLAAEKEKKKVEWDASKLPPAASKGPYDYYELVQTIPADKAFRPLNEGGCPLVAKKS